MCSPNPTTCFHAGGLRKLVEQLESGVVAVQKRVSTRDDAFKYLRLGGGDVFDGIEIPKVRLGNQRDDRDVRPDQLDQGADFARMVHPDLEDRVLAFRRQPRQGKRHAPVVVERPVRGMHAADRRQHMAQRFLGRRLADRTGHGDDLGPAALPSRGPQALESLQHILDHDHRRFQAAECRQLGFGDDQQPGAGRDRRRREIVAIEFIATDRKKGFAGTKGPGVDRYARNTFRQVADRPAVHGFHHL